MIYAVITEPGEELPSLYIFDTWDSYHAATFNPENEIQDRKTQEPLYAAIPNF